MRAGVPRPSNVRGAAEFKVMKVDLSVVGRSIQKRSEELQKLFLQ